MEPSSVSCQRTVKLAVSFHPLFDRDLFAVRGDHLEVSQVQVDRVVEVRAERPLLDRVEPGSAIEPIGSNVSPLTVHARPEPRRKSNRRSLELTGSELATVMNISLEGELTGSTRPAHRPELRSDHPAGGPPGRAWLRGKGWMSQVTSALRGPGGPALTDSRNGTGIEWVLVRAVVSGAVCHHGCQGRSPVAAGQHPFRNSPRRTLPG